MWLLVGPNGAGKSTYYERVVAPHLNAPFVNADHIARARWPVHYARHAYDAARLAARTRDALLLAGKSFVAETVFSHPSKLDLIRRAKARGYVLWMSYINVASPELAVARVGQRLRQGGHPVPPDKVRERYRRIGANVLAALPAADRLAVVDNGAAGKALRDVLLFEQGAPVWAARDLPAWAGAQFAGLLPRR